MEQRLDRIETKLDKMDEKIDTLVATQADVHWMKKLLLTAWAAILGMLGMKLGG